MRRTLGVAFGLWMLLCLLGCGTSQNASQKTLKAPAAAVQYGPQTWDAPPPTAKPLKPETAPAKSEPAPK